MISQYLASIEGIEIVGLALLLLSFVSWLAIAVWAARADGAYVTTMERLPLESADDTPEHLDEAER